MPGCGARKSQSEWFRRRRLENGGIDDFWLGGSPVPGPSECAVFRGRWRVTTLPASLYIIPPLGVRRLNDAVKTILL